MSTFDLGPVRALRPDERDDAPVVGLGEFFNATWEEGRKASNFDAHLKNYSDAFDGIADRVKAATGEALDNPFRSATLGQSAELLTTFSREAVDASSPVTAWRQRVRELQAKHADKLDWDSLIDEPGKVAFASMKKAREDADALAERAGMIAPRDVPVLGGVPVVNSIAALGVNAVRHPGYTAAQLAAAIGSQMTSPADAAVNLISFGVGGTAKSIIKNATMNALSNAAGQALLSGPKQLAYQSAGLPYGWGVWAEEVGAAAGAGFAIDAGIRTPIRAAVNRFGRDTEAGTLFSRNTARGGFFLDAVTDATPTPRVRPTLDIDPETIKKAEAGDLAASKEILEKTGALNDPAVRYAVDHIEGGGKLTDEALRVLENMGVARPDGMRLLADALTGRMPEAMPEPVRAADAPLMPERGAPLLGRLAEVQDQVARLPARVQEAVADGLEAGLPAVVRAVEEAFSGPRETFPERLAQAIDARTIAAARLHGGRAGAVEAARYIRQFPDLIDDTVPLEAGRIEQARAIARLDDGAFAAVAEGAVPPEVAALISSRVPKAQQSRVIGDLEKARPRSMAEAADLIETLTMPERVAGELAPGARIVDPSGPEAKAHLEALRGEAGPAYEAAMAPIRRRDEIESEIETKRGQIAKMEQEAQKAPDSPETKEGASPDEQIAAARAELRDLEAELAQVQGEIDPSPGGQKLYRVAMRALALRREADVIRAINDAMDMGRRMAPEGTRIDVVNEIDAGGGRVADAVAMPDGSIQLAIAAVDPMAKIGHEAVHVLVTKGHLSPDEVSALAALAREAGTFKDEAAYRETYADRQSLDRLIEEEAAASYIEARIKGTAEGPANTIVERVKQLFERIKQALAGVGFQSREDVVQAILNGEAARRQARSDWARNAQVEARSAMQRQMADGVELPDGTKVNGVKLYAIRAFHGSPHDFDRFSLDKIGTGEGAQAYGHGLYFAESELTAKWYKDQLANRAYSKREVAKTYTADELAQMASAEADKTRRANIMDVIGEMKKGRPFSDVVLDMPEYPMTYTFGEDIIKKPGRLYEVSIKADPEDFLDWDKPLSQQSETVRKTIEPALGKAAADLGKGTDPQKIAQLEAMGLGNIARRMMPKEIDPWSIDVQTLAKQYPDALREAGIPGIKYLDQGSRSAGEGSRNYVVFDDNLIEIVAKDGQPVQGQKMFAFAGKNARTADLAALSKAQEIVGNDKLYSLRSDDIDRLPNTGKRQYKLVGGATGEPKFSPAMARVASILAKAQISGEFVGEVGAAARRAVRNPEIFEFGEGVRQARDSLAEGKQNIEAVREEYKGTPFRYDIQDEAGAAVGYAEGLVMGDTMFFDFLGDTSSRNANRLGIGALKNLREQVRKDFPDVTTFMGYRVSGARAASGSDNRMQSVKMFSLRSDLDMSPEARKQRAQEMGFDTSRVAYRGLSRPYSETDGRYYQMFTSNPYEAGEYAGDFDHANVIAAWLRKGNNLSVDAREANFNSVPTDQLPEAMRNRLGPTARTDEIAHAAREAGYDSVTITNVYDNATNEKVLTSGVSPEIAAARKKKLDAEMDSILAELGLSDDDMKSLAMASPASMETAEIKRGPVTIDAVFAKRNIRSVNADFDPSRSDSPNLMYAIRSDEPSLKQDMATVDRMNRIGELIQACRA